MKSKSKDGGMGKGIEGKKMKTEYVLCTTCTNSTQGKYTLCTANVHILKLYLPVIVRTNCVNTCKSLIEQGLDTH